MFNKNVGKLDRIIRVAIGIILLAGFFLGWGGGANWLLLIGIVPIATAVFNFCPAYTLFGINSCPLHKR